MVEKKIPQDKCLDHTLSFLKEGYFFISDRVNRYHSDIFETRLLGKKVICIRGEEAAKVFYNNKLFRRKGALPKRVLKTLFGINAIQTLDGTKHLHRKHFFQSVVNPEARKRLIEIAVKKWEKAAGRWENCEQIQLFNEANTILCQSVCEWAQVPLNPAEEKNRIKDFRDMVSSFGSVGLKYWNGKMARKRTEKWMKQLIEDTRAGRLNPDKNSALYQAAWYKEGSNLLDSHMAAVELINILRPTIAVSRYITFLALALRDHPACREKLIEAYSSCQEGYPEMFVQEVRRYYPFVPCLGAIVKRDFKWKGWKFRRGTLVLLDIYGMSRDPHIWENPEEFEPERFRGGGRHLFDFIPHGGGSVSTGHRCPGRRLR